LIYILKIRNFALSKAVKMGRLSEFYWMANAETGKLKEVAVNVTSIDFSKVKVFGEDEPLKHFQADTYFLHRPHKSNRSYRFVLSFRKNRRKFLKEQKLSNLPEQIHFEF
jgi:hypothetical protein